MPADALRIAKNIERMQIAIAAHDRENPTHTAFGIGMAAFDMERLGIEEGEALVPGFPITADGGQTGNFRVLCDSPHDDDRRAEAEEAQAYTRAVGIEV